MLAKVLRCASVLAVCLWWFAAAATASAAQSYQQGVVIPVHQGIERGLESFLQRAFHTAKEQGADLVILDINTPGGEVEAASEIGQLVRQAPMHVVAFIDDQAFSAGTYIALNADEIVMTPGSSMGAAAPIDRVGNAADVKLMSAWSEKMVAAAKLHNRNPDVARAMVEIDTPFPGLKPKGTVLSLDADQARKLGYADRIVADKAELYRALGIQPDRVTELEPSLSEKVARIVTSPAVMSLLLVVGLVGLVVELFVPGFSVPGTIGLLAFALYFFGHFVAGFASWIHIALFVIGILLMVMELFLPGGIVGALGFLSLVSGLVLAAYDTAQGLKSLGIAVLAALVVTFVLAKYFGARGVWNRLILRDEQRSEAGYVAPKDQRDLLGEAGVALTPLRPAGIARIGARRVDAVSVGDFIAPGTPVVVVQVEGTRVVVQKQEMNEKE